jgi:hypothetical protein
MEIRAGFTRYLNRSGGSGVLAYKLIRSGIQIQFDGGAAYEYTAALTGADQVEILRRLAEQGRGLSGYIGSHREQLKFRRLDSDRSD